MKVANLTLMVLVSFFSSKVFGLTYNCELNLDSDGYNRVTLLANGNLEVQFYEFHTEIEAAKVSSQSASTFSEVDTHLTIVNNATVNYSVEGDEGTALTTVLFVYNPVQKAGRLTFVQDGRTMARNRLFTNCN
jgi:hypothetical protein